ncbi:hypothetical protein AN5383.2 [Aspergillus nidulans FGSC A4]|uniref:Heterokaryon incompatibility domain-containing protein n=1 Tax=Emericella nidulans (strain FGSC A4 / ATCC 38163 / CBS 112.46 / NRRL 194 / M139) TaxID=227321 RepID=Q5B247_EMENI|nr:hypothetical protein [Aspergillus nidulans FGSC A4]EAA62543.1 hypothetical protein AN5383.2 [Aspergillus nidulans FGSC A4]CBF82002.1 TPA: conserved hypothetical protein [Aspergillus nidulans FGSC A4]|eukprot:XP_662987.1 hypothetical protein AN5383.2 [Aspergillus nidulans FGSC A4]
MLYSELKRGEFRLLKVHAGEAGNELHCNLEVRTLYTPRMQSERPPGDRAPDPEPYEALSYAWESREPQQSLNIIQCDDFHTVKVYPSLKAALLQLRQPRSPRYLWVDALCINQKDKEEKGGQVKEMWRIYSQAQRVCVWLGPEKDESSRAIHFIQNRLQDDDTDSLMTDANLAKDWAALYKIITRPWFSRRWIIQEIALAKTAIVYCGGESISWDVFANATSFFVSAPTRLRHMCRTSPVFNYDEHHFGDLGESAAARLVDLAGHIFSKEDNGVILGRSLPLEELLCSLHMFNTSEPRDAVYAIISIAEDAKPGFKVPEETSTVLNGDFLTSSPRPLSPITEHLSSTTADLSQLRRRSSSVDLRAGNGNLGPALSTNFHGHKRALSRSSAQDDVPPTRLKLDQPHSDAVPNNDDSVHTSGGVPGILVSGPDQSHPPPRSGSTLTTETAPDHPSDLQHPQTPHLEPRGRFASFSSASSTREEAMLNKALKRIERSYIDSRIPVDYTKPLHEVCKDVLSFTFRASNSLNMICRPWAPTDPSLPSWVPTMSNSAFSLAGDGVYVRVRADPLVGGPRPGQGFYRAAKNAPALWSFGETEDNRPCLTVTGFELDTIKDKTSPAASGVVPGEWNEFVGWTDPHTAPPDPFWKTLVGNRDAMGQRARTFWKTVCQRAFQRRPPNGDLNVEKTMRTDNRDHVREYLERVLRTVCSRRLAILSNIPPSHSLSLVPYKAKKGDKVCIINGCSVPILLRRSEQKTGHEDYYEMIGECYVHGMMDGEASSYKKKRGIRDATFCLI